MSGILSGVSSEVDGIWVPYTPAWTTSGTQPVLNNGALSGRYALIGKTLLVKLDFTAGSTTTFGTGSWFFSLPFSTVSHVGMGVGEAEDTSAGQIYFTSMRWASATTFSPCLIVLANPVTFFSNTVPFTWATDDKIRADCWYEVA